MSTHYNAFISYKHGELDNRVAAEVQTQLERFRIPKAIQESTGIRKIDRIFRDKEELNITSDLNDTIESALQNSDYLIVICSTHTRGSIWVQREIEFFLKTHPIEKVLTVVAEGEPVDVVPEILFHREMELMTEEGNLETVRVPVEPLSCDYRMKLSKARREELPRLAAAILGCGYDDLRQRQRKYRQRRLVIAASAAAAVLVALTGYYAYTAAQIRENYEQSLINQSEYLSSESRKAMESGDRMTAMLLAMEALPTEDNDRPVTASAQLALSNALYAYIPPGGNTGGAGVGIRKSFDHGGTIDMYQLTEDAKYLAVAHSGDSITLWDFEAGEILFEESYNVSVQNMIFTGENTLVVATDIEIFCLEPETGEKLWSQYYYYDAGLAGSIFTSSFVSVCLAVSPTEPMMVLENENCLYFIDTVTGEMLQTYEENKKQYPEEIQPYLGFNHLVFSPDGRKLGGSFQCDNGLYPDSQPFVYDLDSGTMYLIPDFLPRFEEAMFTPEGNLIVAGSYIPDEFSYTSDGYDYFWINGMEINCYDPEEKNLLWNNAFTFADYYEGTHLLLSDFLLEDETTVSALICGAANTVVALDLASGETLSTLLFEDTVLYMEATEGFATVTMKNGRIAIGYWNQFIGSTAYSIPNVASVTLKPKVLVLGEDSSSLLWYNADVFDDSWTAFSGENKVNFGFFTAESNGCCILEGYDDVYYHVGPRECRVTWTLPIEGDGFVNEYIGYDAAAEEYVFYECIGEVVSRYSLQGELVSQMPLSLRAYRAPDPDAAETWDEIFEGYFASDTPKLLRDEIYYPIRSLETNRYSIAIEQEEGPLVIELPESVGFLEETYPAPDGRYVLVKANDNSYVLVDVAAGTAEETWWSLELEETRIAWNGDSSLLAASDMGKVRIFSGETEIEIDTHGVTVIDLEFLGDVLLVVYADGNLIRYNARDGSYMGQSDISAQMGFGGYTEVNWIFSNQEAYVVSIDDTFNLIDPETWSVYATIRNVIAYDLEQARVVVPRVMEEKEITEEHERMELGYFHLYTPAELVEKAKGVLGGTVLSQEQRTQYGLG